MGCTFNPASSADLAHLASCKSSHYPCAATCTHTIHAWHGWPVNSKHLWCLLTPPCRATHSPHSDRANDAAACAGCTCGWIIGAAYEHWPGYVIGFPVAHGHMVVLLHINCQALQATASNLLAAAGQLLMHRQEHIGMRSWPVYFAAQCMKVVGGCCKAASRLASILGRACCPGMGCCCHKQCCGLCVWLT